MPAAITVTSMMITEGLAKSFSETILFLYFVKFHLKNLIIQRFNDNKTSTISHLVINLHV